MTKLYKLDLEGGLGELVFYNKEELLKYLSMEEVKGDINGDEGFLYDHENIEDMETKKGMEKDLENMYLAIENNLNYECKYSGYSFEVVNAPKGFKKFQQLVEKGEVLLTSNYNGFNSIIHKKELKDFIKINTYDFEDIDKQHMLQLEKVANGELKKVEANEDNFLGVMRLESFEEFIKNIHGVEYCGFFEEYKDIDIAAIIEITYNMEK